MEPARDDAMEKLRRLGSIASGIAYLALCVLILLFAMGHLSGSMCEQMRSLGLGMLTRSGWCGLAPL